MQSLIMKNLWRLLLLIFTIFQPAKAATCADTHRLCSSMALHGQCASVESICKRSCNKCPPDRYVYSKPQLKCAANSFYVDCGARTRVNSYEYFCVTDVGVSRLTCDTTWCKYCVREANVVLEELIKQELIKALNEDTALRTSFEAQQGKLNSMGLDMNDAFQKSDAAETYYDRLATFTTENERMRSSSVQSTYTQKQTFFFFLTDDQQNSFLWDFIPPLAGSVSSLVKREVQWSYNSTHNIARSKRSATEKGWRHLRGIKRIKNQGFCRSSWAMSAATVIEALHEILTDVPIILSAQQLVDCTGYDDGCEGGAQHTAFQYASQTAMVKAPVYRYKSKMVDVSAGACRKSELRMKHHGFIMVKSYAEHFVGAELTTTFDVTAADALLKKIINTKGPVSAAIAGHRNMFYYSAGVYDGECGTTLNHAVTVIGYGTTADGIDYWLIANSWGKSWGENGLMRLNSENTCGLLQYFTYPEELELCEHFQQRKCEAHEMCYWHGSTCATHPNVCDGKPEKYCKFLGCFWETTDKRCAAPTARCFYDQASQTACEASSFCKWTTHSTCTISSQYCGDTSDRNTCNDLWCNWNWDASTCDPWPVFPCWRHRTETECKTSSKCRWYGVKCAKSDTFCATVTSEPDCEEFGCKWELTGPHGKTCGPPTRRCFVRNTAFYNEAVCGREHLCSWSNDSQTCNVQTEVCEDSGNNHNKADCELLDCAWTASNPTTKCDRPNIHDTGSCFKQLGTSVAECPTRAGSLDCYWYGSACGPAKETCVERNKDGATARTSCLKSGCSWEQNTYCLSPSFRCYLAPDRAENRVACEHDSLCTWTTNFCNIDQTTCDAATAADECENIVGCLWDTLDTNTKCLSYEDYPCFLMETFDDCFAQPNCYWYRSECQTRPSICIAETTEAQCTYKGCSWSATHSKCYPLTEGCYLDNTAFASEKECDAKLFCEWVPEFNVCGTHSILTSSKCKKRRAYQCNAYTANAECSANHHCQWNSISCQTKTETCEVSEDAKICCQKSTCLWSKYRPNKKCYAAPTECLHSFALDDQKSCNAKDECEWMTSSAYCNLKPSICMVPTDQATCETMGCLWDSSCKLSNVWFYGQCFLLNTATLCAANAKCQWYGTVCLDKWSLCQNAIAYSQCFLMDCFWIYDAPFNFRRASERKCVSPTKRCFFGDRLTVSAKSDKCEKHPLCTWSSFGFCDIDKDVCSTATSESDCTPLSCEWTSSNACQPYEIPCHLYKTDRFCSRNTLCHWYINFCAPTELVCTGKSTQADCEYPGCFWSSTTSGLYAGCHAIPLKCAAEASRQLSAGACSAGNTFCTWNTLGIGFCQVQARTCATVDRKKFCEGMGCKWASSKCSSFRSAYPCEHLPVKVECSGVPYCSHYATFCGTSETACKALTNTKCAAAGCHWSSTIVNGGCLPKAAMCLYSTPGFTTSGNCPSAMCVWDAAKFCNLKTTIYADIDDEDTCGSVGGRWDSGTCHPAKAFPCAAIKKTSCDPHPFCHWYDAVCLTHPDICPVFRCTASTAASGCSDLNCLWSDVKRSPSTAKCYTQTAKCTLNPANQVNVAACPTDLCEWSAVGFCTIKPDICSPLSSQSQCEALDCVWAGGNECKTHEYYPCKTLKNTKCTVPFCEKFGSSCGSSTAACSLLQQKDCTSSKCHWSILSNHDGCLPIIAECMFKSPLHSTSSSCSNVADNPCTWNSDGFCHTNQAIVSSITDSTTCVASGASWSSSTCSIPKRYPCADLAETDCNTLPYCYWYATICGTHSDVCTPLTAKTTCEEARCYWASVLTSSVKCVSQASKCLYDLSKQQSQSSCSSDSICEWKPTGGSTGFCRPVEALCTAESNSGRCGKIGCTWSSSCAAYKRLPCEMLSTSDCELTGHCTHLDSFCGSSLSVCNDQTSQSECEDRDCFWSSTIVNGGCLQKPAMCLYSTPGFTTSSDCPSAMCVWDAAKFCNLKTTIYADIDDEDTCGSVGGRWDSGTCHPATAFPCAAIKKTSCDPHPFCHWYDAVCLTHPDICTAATAASGCSDLNCFWSDVKRSPSTAKCYAQTAKCTLNFANQVNVAACPTDICEWSAVGFCTIKPDICSSLSSQSQCEAVDCVWAGGNACNTHEYYPCKTLKNTKCTVPFCEKFGSSCGSSTAACSLLQQTDCTSSKCHWSILSNHDGCLPIVAECMFKSPLHSTSSSCRNVADNPCTWNSDGFCHPNQAVVDSITDSTTCVAVGASWSSTTCSIPNLYPCEDLGKDDCKTMPYCYWYSTICGTHSDVCTPLTAKTTCEEARCYWASVLKSSVKCVSQASKCLYDLSKQQSQSSCSSDSICEWKPTGGSTGFCRPVEALCTAESNSGQCGKIGCTWSSSCAAYKRLPCEMLSTSNCELTGHCTHLDSFCGSSLSVCNAQASQSECEDRDCFWSSTIVNGGCLPKPAMCLYSTPGFTTSSACPSTMCVWDTAKFCNLKTTIYAAIDDEDTCGSVGGRWDSGTCHPATAFPCAAIQKTSCDPHPFCYWYSTICGTHSDVCTPLTAKTTCEEARCYWASVLKSSVKCVSQASKCLYELSKQQSQSSCSSDSICEWKPTGGSTGFCRPVEALCTAESNSGPCGKIGCTWSSSCAAYKRLPCETLSTSECELTGHCTHLGSFCGSSLSVCNAQTSQSDCADRDCFWSTISNHDGCQPIVAECMFKQPVISTSQSCSAVTNTPCSWSTAGFCHPNTNLVNDIDDSATCTAIGASWSTSTCDVPQQFPCNDLAQSDCHLLPYCYWYTTSCGTHPDICDALTAQTSCEDAGCYWATVLTAGAKQCMGDSRRCLYQTSKQQSAVTCSNEDIFCEWKNSGTAINYCTPTPAVCTAETDATRCASLGCEWVSATCVQYTAFPCETLSQTDCEQTSYCSKYGSLCGSSLATCAAQTTPSNCARTNCFWATHAKNAFCLPAISECLYKISVHTQSTCASASDCVWKPLTASSTKGWLAGTCAELTIYPCEHNSAATCALWDICYLYDPSTSAPICLTHPESCNELKSIVPCYQAKCYWVTVQSLCFPAIQRCYRDQLTYQTQTSCESTNLCEWETAKSFCHIKDDICTRAPTSSLCDKLDCEGQVQTCSMIDEDKCERNFRQLGGSCARWAQYYCAAYNSGQQLCESNHQCEWNNGISKCIEK